MQRLVAVTVVAIGSALPFTAAAQTPTQDSVKGSGLQIPAFCGGSFEVNAQSGATGEHPTGSVDCGSLFSGPVTCLNLTGNVALLNLQSRTVGTVGFRISDLGASGDLVEASIGPTCPIPNQFFFSKFRLLGNVVVVDASPLPTSKDECKNGGWRTHGAFKNQGDCVSFVATKGKKPPSGP
jgi:hypothetical protein